MKIGNSISIRPPKKQTESILLKFPPEIRREIFALVLLYKQPLTFYLPKRLESLPIPNQKDCSNQRMRPSTSALCHTSRTFYQECTPIFYKENSFMIPDDKVLRLLVADVQPRTVQMIQKLHIYYVAPNRFPFVARLSECITHFTNLQVLSLSDEWHEYQLVPESTTVPARRHLEAVVADTKELKELEVIELNFVLELAEPLEWEKHRKGFAGLPGWGYGMTAEKDGLHSIAVTETLKKIQGPMYPLKERGGRHGDEHDLEEGMALFQAEIGAAT